MTLITKEKQAIDQAKRRFYQGKPFWSIYLSTQFGSGITNDSLMSIDQNCGQLLQKVQAGFEIDSEELNPNKFYESRSIAGYRQFVDNHSINYLECLMDLRYYCQGIIVFVAYRPRLCYGFVGNNSDSQVQLYLADAIGNEDLQLNEINRSLQNVSFTKEVECKNAFGGDVQKYWIELSQWALTDYWIKERLERKQ